MIEVHPLLNPDSPHYETPDGKICIEELEKKMKINDMIGWCIGSVGKYNCRLGQKDAIEKEKRKIITYNNYHLQLIALQDQIGGYVSGAELSVAKGWERIGKKWNYRP